MGFQQFCNRIVSIGGMVLKMGNQVSEHILMLGLRWWTRAHVMDQVWSSVRVTAEIQGEATEKPVTSAEAEDIGTAATCQPR